MGVDVHNFCIAINNWKNFKTKLELLTKMEERS